MAQRFDRGSLRRPEKLENGFLRADAYVTRIGVFGYLNEDGSIRRELRHPDDVFDAKSLGSLSMIPVTDGHPDAMIDAKNVKKHSVGTTGENARRDERFVRSTVQIQDAGTVGRIESGETREFSCGYHCRKDMTAGVTDGIPGIPDGIRYDLRQTDIRYNHLAVLQSGRAGPECSVPRMDGLGADSAIMVFDSNTPNEQPSQRLDSNWSGDMDAEIRIDGIPYKTSEQAATAFRMFVERADAEKASLETKVKDADEKAAKETARADAADEKAKAAEAKVTDALKPEAIAKLVADRVALEVTGRKVLGEKTEDGKDIKLDGMTDIEIKTAVVKKLSPDAKLDGKDEAYICTRFDIAIEDLPASEERSDAANRSHANVHDAATQARESNTDSAAAQKRMNERLENAWKRDKK